MATDAGRAAIAQAWCEGYMQWQISKCFGLRNPGPVCVRIEQFIKKFCPEKENTCWLVYGDARKKLALKAIIRYRASMK